MNILRISTGAEVHPPMCLRPCSHACVSLHSCVNYNACVCTVTRKRLNGNELMLRVALEGRKLLMLLPCLVDVKCGLEYGPARVYLNMPINFKKRQLNTMSLSAIKQVRLATLNCSHLFGQVRFVPERVVCLVWSSLWTGRRCHCILGLFASCSQPVHK